MLNSFDPSMRARLNDVLLLHQQGKVSKHFQNFLVSHTPICAFVAKTGGSSHSWRVKLCMPKAWNMVLGASIWVRLKTMDAVSSVARSWVSKTLIPTLWSIWIPRLESIGKKCTHRMNSFVSNVYAGITGQAEPNYRPGSCIRIKYGYPSTKAMIDDGWIILRDVVQFPEPDFFCRRYTTAWTKRLLQLYIEAFGNWVEVISVTMEWTPCICVSS